MCTPRLRPIPVDVRTPHLRGITHTVASSVTLIYKRTHIHTQENTESQQCFKLMEKLLSSTQTPTDLHTQALPNGQGQTRVHAQQHLRKIQISVPFQAPRYTETAHPSQWHLPLSVPLPAFQSFTSIALRKEFRVKFLSRP